MTTVVCKTGQSLARQVHATNALYTGLLGRYGYVAQAILVGEIRSVDGGPLTLTVEIRFESVPAGRPQVESLKFSATAIGFRLFSKAVEEIRGQAIEYLYETEPGRRK